MYMQYLFLPGSFLQKYRGKLLSYESESLVAPVIHQAVPVSISKSNSCSVRFIKKKMEGERPETQLKILYTS
jgi:hypothetical protein